MSGSRPGISDGLKTFIFPLGRSKLECLNGKTFGRYGLWLFGFFDLKKKKNGFKKNKNKAELTTLAYIITYWGFYVILQGSDDSMNGCAGCVLGSSHTGLETSWCPVDNNWSLKKNMHFMTGINSCLTIPCSMEILLAIALVASRLPELPQFEWKTATCLQQVGDSFQNCRKKNWAFINFNILFVFCSYLFPRLSYRNDK